MALAKEAYPLLASGHLKQFAVERLIPMPRQAGLGESGIEGGAMAVALGIRKRSVDIKNQCFEHGG